MYGVIDLGSNTIRLALYKVIDNTLQLKLSKKHTAGLVGYVKKRRLTPEGIRKAVDVLNDFRMILENVRVERLYVFATASLRNIDNTLEVTAEIKKNTGFDIDVLSGNEEAVFDYYGAMQTVDMRDGLLVDIGGGSTELVFYQNSEIVFTESIPLGSLNAYSANVADLLPTPDERKNIGKAVISELDKITVSCKNIPTDMICGVGGTVRASRGLYNALKEKGPAATEYNTQDLKKMIDLAENDRKAAISLILKVAPERIHTLLPGMIILQTIAEYYASKKIVVSKSGVRDGYLYHKLETAGVIQAE
jgi:exopolyphosphatase/guanosine-5'-triphosphate,3'-diphosphate pyrophosphatase